MTACSKRSSNSNENDDSKQPPQPSVTSIATNSHNDHDFILHSSHFLPPALPISNYSNSSSSSSSPPPPPPPSSSSSRRRIPAILSYTKIKSHGKECWSSMKSRFEEVVREPAARRRRRWSSSLRWSSEESSGSRKSMGSRRWNSKNERDSWPADEEESLFCEGLVGLMRRCGRMGTIIADDDDDDADGGMEGSDSPVPQAGLTI